MNLSQLSQPIASDHSPQEGWTTVTRRRRPSHFTQEPLQQRTSSISTFSPTYAQIVRTNPNTTQQRTTPILTHSNPPHRPALTTQQRYIQSPHSPNPLRHPPSPYYHEWWGRCFRCTRKGHVAADCNLPRLHLPPVALPNLVPQTGTTPPSNSVPIPTTQLTQALARSVITPLHQPNHLPSHPRSSTGTATYGTATAGTITHRINYPPPLPHPSPPQMETRTSVGPADSMTQPAPPRPKRTRAEPAFNEFLSQPEPTQRPLMPTDRPRKAHCYFNRDDLYFDTLQKTLRGIVLCPPRRSHPQITLDQAAAIVASSAIVTQAQLQPLAYHITDASSFSPSQRTEIESSRRFHPKCGTRATPYIPTPPSPMRQFPSHASSFGSTSMEPPWNSIRKPTSPEP